MRYYYHATTLADAVNILRSQIFYLHSLDWDGKKVWGFFATKDAASAEMWGYQLIYERNEDPPPAVLEFLIPDEMIEEEITDPVALSRKAESYFVILKDEYIDRENGILPLHQITVNLAFPVNEKELIGGIEYSLYHSAIGGWEGETYLELEPEIQLILEDDQYRELKAQLLALERAKDWFELVNAWNEYVSKRQQSAQIEEDEEGLEDFSPININTEFWQELQEQSDEISAKIDEIEQEFMETETEETTSDEENFSSMEMGETTELDEDDEVKRLKQLFKILSKLYHSCS